MDINTAASGNDFAMDDFQFKVVPPPGAIISGTVQLEGIVALSALFAAATWRRSRAFALPRSERVAWVIFVLLAGLPGYVGYRLHRRWPLRQDCPHCNTRVPWDREVCAACGKSFPSAPVKGIEILCSGGQP